MLQEALQYVVRIHLFPHLVNHIKIFPPSAFRCIRCNKRLCSRRNGLLQSDLDTELHRLYCWCCRFHNCRCTFRYCQDAYSERQLRKQSQWCCSHQGSDQERGRHRILQGVNSQGMIIIYGDYYVLCAHSASS